MQQFSFCIIYDVGNLGEIFCICYSLRRVFTGMGEFIFNMECNLMCKFVICYERIERCKREFVGEMKEGQIASSSLL